MKAFTNKAIVIGSSHINTLGTIRSLGERGVPVYAIITGTKGNFLEGIRYLKGCWSVARTEEAILDVLLNYMVKDRYNKTVVILTNDFCVTVIDKNLEKLKDYHIVPNIGMKSDKIVSLMNKEKMR